MKTKLKFLLLPLVTFPLFAQAASSFVGGGIRTLILSIGRIIYLLIPISVAVALLAFFWGLAQSINHSRDGGDGYKEGKEIAIWGLVALFVMVSIWGLVAFIQQNLGIPANIENL